MKERLQLVACGVAHSLCLTLQNVATGPVPYAGLCNPSLLNCACAVYTLWFHALCSKVPCVRGMSWRRTPR